MSLAAHPASSQSCRRVSVAIALLATCLNLSQARAQSSAEVETALNSPDYKEFIRKALQEYGLGNWTEARVFFGKAHTIAPNARTLRGLALVSYESRRYVETLSYAEQAFANPIQPLTPQMQSDLRRFVEQARSFVARARIVSDPAGAERKTARSFSTRANTNSSQSQRATNPTPEPSKSKAAPKSASTSR
jgi:hypothetical protein